MKKICFVLLFLFIISFLIMKVNNKEVLNIASEQKTVVSVNYESPDVLFGDYKKILENNSIDNTLFKQTYRNMWLEKALFENNFNKEEQVEAQVDSLYESVLAGMKLSELIDKTIVYAKDFKDKNAPGLKTYDVVLLGQGKDLIRLHFKLSSIIDGKNYTYDSFLFLLKEDSGYKIVNESIVTGED